MVVSAMLVLVLTTDAQNPKGKYVTFALTNATIETITKGTISNGFTVILQGGKITSVGTNIAVPEGAEVINCNGLKIYPGMVDGGTQLGLSEVGSDKKTQDFNESGEVIPQLKALTAVNPNAVGTPVTRVSGVTTTSAKPEEVFFKL